MLPYLIGNKINSSEMKTDSLSGPLRVLSSFAEDYLPKLDPFYLEWDVEKILREDSDIRRHGFDLAMRIAMAAYHDVLDGRGFQKEVKSSLLTFSGDATVVSPGIYRDESYVPETMDICESSPIIESTCLIVPETQVVPLLSQEHQGDIFRTPDTKKKVQQRKRSPVNSFSKCRDASDKYSPLTCLQSEMNNETTLSLGALGTGPNPTKPPKKLQAPTISDGQSPSLLRPSTSRRVEERVFIEDEDENQSDFKEIPSFKPKDISPPSKKRKSKKGTDGRPISNRFGIYVIETTDSQKKRNSSLKQQSISKYAVSGNAQEPPKKRVDTELERVMALSLETKNESEEKRKKTELRSPLKNLLLDGSLDLLPGERATKKSPDFKFVGSPVRKKQERLALPAFECRECRDFYAGSNLTEDQLKELLQKCSKHRSRNPPLASSPQYCWNLDLRPDNTQDKTQVARPLRTRKRLKNLEESD